MGVGVDGGGVGGGCYSTSRLHVSQNKLNCTEMFHSVSTTYNHMEIRVNMPSTTHAHIHTRARARARAQVDCQYSERKNNQIWT